MDINGYDMCIVATHKDEPISRLENEKKSVFLCNFLTFPSEPFFL